ncbi:S-layer homology domain-containing protein [Phosphitispora fastidiosa]|uniref:S-layer homology domain-containing protein n=1 Tax=Phosphitispora fastidiosa TaxID=2837202 RepID=UPI001E5ADF81|nr:S-layer homology domain-containing protein [Phosphitispora fastidiosa]MBU7006143.1 hypothetical protein [Phosphitispora fastidiosa]
MKRLFLKLVTILLFSQFASVPSWAASSLPGHNFSDVPANHWAHEAVSELASRGIVKGFPDGMFRPDLNVTREQFAVMIVLAAGLETSYSDTPKYRDVPPDYWAYPYIEAAKPYFSGYTSDSGSYFKPSSVAVREDVAAALVRAKGYADDEPNLALLEEKFVDRDQISPEAKKLVSIAVEKELIKGYPDHTFRGKGNVTRAEAAAAIYSAAFFKPNELAGIVASVNGEEITREKLDSDFEKARVALSEQGVTFDGADDQKQWQELERQTLQRIIELTLIKQAAKREGLFPSDEDIAAKVEEIKSSFGNEAQFQDALQQYGYTIEELADRACDEMVYENLYKKVTDNINIDEEDFQEHYDSVVSLDGQPISLNEARGNYILMIEQEKFNEYLEKLRSEAEIDIYLV